MARVRLELGADALILATRRVEGGVELTAALESDDNPVQPTSPDPDVEAQLRFHCVPPGLAERLLAGPLDRSLAQTMTFAPLPLGPGMRPVLFAGPPGAGKTLTVARLATRLVMQGRPPVVITADGRRAGAAEQLAAFTRLLGLDLLVASHPTTLERCLGRREVGPDVPVLIDSPGLDPFDPAQRDELAALASVAGATVALVLPAGLDAAEAADLARAFAGSGAVNFVPTRLDVSRRLGSVLAAADAGCLALAEAGVGPGAADGLAPLSPSLLATRLLAPPAPLHLDRSP